MGLSEKQSGGANRSSLLAHLAPALSHQTELVATKALAYILARSEAARFALAELLRTGGADVGAIERVADEVVGEDQERVDLVAYDQAGAERVLLEAKFWAGLTENQPGTYLRRLPNDGRPAVLLFVAPELRLPTLWPHVKGRAAEAGFRLEDDAKTGGIRSAAIVGASHQRVMLTSWRSLVGAMAARVQVDGDGLAAEDIRQLEALCERQDTDAFLPIRADELGPEVPRRLRDLRRLVDDAVAEAIHGGFANKQGLAVAPRPVGYGTYLRLGSETQGVWAGAWFGVNAELWLSGGHPLWIQFYKFEKGGEGDMPIEEIQRKLGRRDVPLPLPLRREYDEVLSAVVDGLRQEAMKLVGNDPRP